MPRVGIEIAGMIQFEPMLLAHFAVARFNLPAQLVHSIDLVSAKGRVGTHQDIPLQDFVVRSAGSAGWLRAQFIAVRCWRVDGDGTHHGGWLIGQRPGRGQEGEVKYFWSNLPRSALWARMVEYAHRRHWVEQYHEEAKDLLGWDQYQGRRWSGFHRHAVLIMLSYSFLIWLEWREREKRRLPGPPRGVFSPSTG